MTILDVRASLSVVVLVICPFQWAAATTILIDFNDVAPAPIEGGYWNVIAATSAETNNLRDIDGNVLGGTRILFGASDSTENQAVWPAGDTGWIDADAVSDFFFRDPGSGGALFKIKGLDVISKVWKVELVAASQSQDNQPATYTLNQDGLIPELTVNGDFDAYLDGWVAGRTLVWSQAPTEPADGGQILLVKANQGGTSYLNAVRLTAVPEPSSILMIVIASAISALFGGTGKCLLKHRQWYSGAKLT